MDFHILFEEDRLSQSSETMDILPASLREVEQNKDGSFGCVIAKEVIISKSRSYHLYDIETLQSFSKYFLNYSMTVERTSWAL